MEKYKFPKTYHLPWSENISNEDKVLKDISYFKKMHYVFGTIKMDGENTTLYRDSLHARSLDSKHHESRAWVKKYHSEMKRYIPKGWRICGENLFAKHSIHYKKLESYFQVFAIFNDKNICLDEVTTSLFCEDNGFVEVNPFCVSPIEEVHEYFEDACRLRNEEVEGYVIRNPESFHYNDYSKNVAKFVRKNHVQTDQHWMHSKVIKNELVKGV